MTVRSGKNIHFDKLVIKQKLVRQCDQSSMLAKMLLSSRTASLKGKFYSSPT